MKKVINLVLGICAVALLFICWRSIADDQDFNAEVAAREAVVKARLLEIRDAEEAFKNQHPDGEYCADWDVLIAFVKSGKLPIVMKQGTLSDELANCLYKAARKYLPGQRIRTDYTDGDPDFEKNFYLLRNTYAAAVLTENLFYDNPDDLAFLESEEGQKAIVALHVEGITEFLNKHEI